MRCRWLLIVVLAFPLAGCASAPVREQTRAGAEEENSHAELERELSLYAD